LPRSKTNLREKAMADCEGKSCYTRVYQVRNAVATTVGGVAVAGLAPATKTAAENAIKAKAERPKVVGCADPACECVRNGLPDNNFGAWRTRPVTTTIAVGGVNQAVVGTIERKSKKTEQGDCEDPNELMAFLPEEWNGEPAIAIAIREQGRPTKKRRV